MTHHCSGHSFTISHQGTWLVSWKTCLLPVLPVFQARILRKKHLGVVQEKEKEEHVWPGSLDSCVLAHQ